MQPAVSIIIPVFGVEAYIARCARSLFEQTCRDVEFIFVDDGSEDRSMEVLREVLDAYPDVAPRVRIISKRNEGQSLARRDGVAVSRGAYIMLVDADDWIEPCTVEKLLAAAKESDADLVIYDFWKEYGHRRKVDSEKDGNIADKERYRKNLYTYRAYGHICNKFCRRSLCEGLFYPRHSMHEDIVFSTQVIYKARTIVHVKEALYHYDRTNLNSSTRVKKQVRRSRSARNMMDFYCAFAGRPDSPVTGLENELLLRAAWVGFTLDRSIYSDYPFLKDAARHLPLMPFRRVLLVQQLVLKLWLHRK